MKGWSPTPSVRCLQCPERSQEAGMPRSVLCSLSNKVKVRMYEVFCTNLTYCFGQLSHFFAQLKVQGTSKETLSDQETSEDGNTVCLLCRQASLPIEEKVKLASPNSPCCTLGYIENISPRRGKGRKIRRSLCF